ncbi:hypothetical protein COU54_03270 [Candidatus Pacearchaeota archaeon CG10_big_fil_rev_8_21_14_0_10_31_24]|nr:MAG: hypothetical protein COU54_03270 [Candidatus Pacearchaeota archaeon CG10_big_fil_rev_8_21_14_0_10_31_24]
MNLDEYEQQLMTIPNRSRMVYPGNHQERRRVPLLTAELGIYDNYSVLLNGSSERVESFFRAKNYRVDKRNLDLTSLEHPQSFGCLELSSDINRANFEYLSASEGYELRDEILKKAKEDYNLIAVLRPFDWPGKSKMHGKSRAQAGAIIILDLIECIKQENLSACFLNSTGWGHLRDFSRIVFYNSNKVVNNAGMVKND